MKLRLLTAAFLFALTGVLTRLHAQENPKDSISPPVDSTAFFAFPENGFPYGNLGKTYRLTNFLTGFQDYHPRQANLGNYGSAEKQLALPTAPANAFRYRPNNFAWFGFSPENRTFYDSKRPYTKLQYIVGQKQEQNFKVVHAHPFGENCNIAFGFDRVRSVGFYQRQATNNTSINLNGWYRAPGRRYAMLADVYWTIADVAENGGIANDSAFESADQLDRKLVDVNLDAAETNQRLRGAWVKQYFSLGPVADTIPDLSDSTNIRTRIRPSWAIVNTLYISDENYAYRDGLPTSGYYPVIYNDSIATLDSTYLWRFQGGLWLERFDQAKTDSLPKFRRISGKLGGKFESGELWSDTIYTTFRNIFADGAIRLFIGNRWLDAVRAEGWYVVNGTNTGDFRVDVNVASQERDGKIAVAVGAQSALLHPDFIYTRYSGNHLRWVNDFGQFGINSVKAAVYMRKETLRGETTSWVMLHGTFAQYTDPLYFDADLLPAQFNGTVNAVSTGLSWLFGADWLKTRGSATWNLLDETAPIRLPEFIVRGSLFGNFRLFKKALHLQVGVDVTWYSSYFADGYNPNTAQFFVQDAEVVGNYVYLDPWLSIKVKPVRVFVKADHANAGLFGRNYYAVPHYPQNDLALKFGVSWVFND
jgi:hypothetical protein